MSSCFLLRWNDFKSIKSEIAISKTLNNRNIDIFLSEKKDLSTALHTQFHF
jgi:hypothetical protein